jgi:arylsulfatase A-like enzyme
MLNSSSRNVLFIAVDDLRPNLGAYGHSFMHTPRMDELAESGTLFQRAYAQYAFCAPSRNSFMTGRRPDVTRAYSFMNHFREPDVGRNWLSFPQYFRSAGYWAAGAGKLYHPGLPPNFDAADASGRKLSWDSFVWGGDCSGNTNGWPLLQPHVTNVVCLPAVDSCGTREGRGEASESEQIVYGAATGRPSFGASRTRVSSRHPLSTTSPLTPRSRTCAPLPRAPPSRSSSRRA